MLRNYLTTTFRQITRFKGYSVINIAGLALGIASCLIIMLWVQNELSYDRYHEKANNIYRIGIDADMAGNNIRLPVSNYPSSPALQLDFPEIINAVRLKSYSNVLISNNDVRYEEDRLFYADNEIFEIFRLQMVEGDPSNALAASLTAVITEDAAQKYFGDENPLRQTLTVDNHDKFTVTGVIKNIPNNSHLKFDVLLSMKTLENKFGENINHWINFNYITYLLLADKADYKSLEEKFPGFVDRHMGEILKSFGARVDLFLQPLTEIHLYSKLQGELEPAGKIEYVYLFSAVALFILIIACINFINLTTARSQKRAREVGMRKTLGASRYKLILQFLGESIGLCALSAFLAIFLTELALPTINSISGNQLQLSYFSSFWSPLIFAGFILIVGMLAGLYPALYLSSFRPVHILKSGKSGTGSHAGFRNAFVIIQFVICIALLISTITIYSQLDFMRNKSLGFDKEQVVVLSVPSERLSQSLPSIKSELLAISGVKGVTATSNTPGDGYSVGVCVPEGYTLENARMMNLINVDYDFLTVFDMQLVAGRNFSAEMPTDSIRGVIINEAAAADLGWENPVGRTFKTDGTGPGTDDWIEKEIIGVVEDFHQVSLHQPIVPIFMSYKSEYFNSICIKISGDNIIGTVDKLKNKWEQLFPERIFEYSFLNDKFDSQYKNEERLTNILISFSFLAIFIGCLGLIGLTSFITEQRTKEIGIRKVLGASVSNIIRLLTREFIFPVIMANVFAWPIAWYAMNRWLENFAYRTEMNWLTFIICGICAIGVAILTVSYQSVKAATSNPVDAIKYE
ncbi:MAG: ABC transporter permease [candidate division Zixibacteria bacterium]